MLGAEMSHEIAYPLNFLRYLLREGNGGAPVDARDLEAGREELGRLERMFATLHKLKVPEPQLEPVLVLPRVRRALDLVREIMETNRIAASIDVPPDLVVTAEPRSAGADPRPTCSATPSRRCRLARPSEFVRAPTVTEPCFSRCGTKGPESRRISGTTIFNPFVSSKQGSMGLGLAVTQRLVRGFGWSIDVRREEGRTVFGIEIPPARSDRVH